MMWMWLVKCAMATRAMTLASRPSPAGRLSESGSLVDDIDAQNPDAGNLDLDLVAGPHPERRLAPQSDAVGRTGGDDVARLQPRHGRQVLYDGGDVEYHVVGRVVLHDLAVESRRELQTLWIGDDVGRHQPRPERPGGGKVLARGHRVLLEIAHAAVEKAGIARHDRERAGARHVPAALADDDGELALEVEIDRGARPHDAAALRDQRVVQAREHAGHGRQLAADLARMAGVVQADTEDLVGIGNDRLKLDLVELEVGRGALGGGRKLTERLCGNRLAQIGPASRQIDDAAIDDGADLGRARMAKTDHSHGPDPLGRAGRCQGEGPTAKRRPPSNGSAAGSAPGGRRST